MSEVKVPDGYKQTEVGVIPKDWKVKDIGETLTIRHGKDQKQVESAHGQYPIFGTGGQMGWANDFLYNKPSVLIGRKGSINKPRYINVPFWTVDTLFYSQVHNGYDEKFMFYKFCLIDWMNYNEASGVPSLNASTISNVKISVPKKPEQTAIATALSDVDNLIGSLEKLIAKKEAIKTGTMQQLLTGKTRLPEFATHDDGSAKGSKQTELGKIPEDWELIKLDNYFDFKNGLNKAKEFFGYGTPIVNYMDVYKLGSIDSTNIKGKVLVTTDEQINYSAKKGDVFFTRTSETVEEIGLSSVLESDIDKAVFSGFVLRARQKKEVLKPSFMKYCFRTSSSRKQIQGTASYTTRALTNGKLLSQMLVPTPTKPEQTAIATILADMDNEIQALKERLAKTRDIKQGMMQQLLTGKVRLADSYAKSDTQTLTSKGELQA